MSFRSSRKACCLAIALMVRGGVEAQVPGASPTFPPQLGGTPPVSTNSLRVTKKDGLKYLEEELSRSLQIFSGKASLDGVLAPPPVQQPVATVVTPARRSKDNSDSRDRWGLLERPGDSDSEEKADILKTRESKRPNEDGRSLQEIYDRARQQSVGGLDSGSMTSARDRSLYSKQNSGALDSRQDDALPPSLREKERTLREKLFGDDDGRDGGYDSAGASIFSVSFNHQDDHGLTREQTQAHKDYLDRYREVLAISPSPSGGLQNALGAQQTGMPGQPANGRIGSLDTLPTTVQRDNAAPTPSTMNSILRPTALPDTRSEVLNRWNPLYEAPTYEPAKTAGPTPPPFMEAPRRKF